MQQRLSPQLLDMAEEVGKFIEYWGFKCVHGKIWALLYLSQKPLSASDFITAFGISKALVSISVKTLLQYRVILESGRSNYGTQLYEANPEVFEVITEVLRQRELKMLAQIKSAHSLLASLPDNKLANQDLSRERIQSLGDMIANADVSLRAILNAETVDMEAWTRFH